MSDDPNIVALKLFGKRRINKVKREARGRISTNTLLAIGLRETWLRNIAGDYGHGRGVFQIDDRWHESWLAKTPGCDSGSYIVRYRSALPAGRVPTLRRGCRRAVSVLIANLRYAENAGIPHIEQVRFAIAAYNAGPGFALKGWREGNVDKYTAGGDYSQDVLRRRAIVRNFREG